MKRTRGECLDIALQAHKEIKDLIEKWETNTGIHACWDEYMIIDGFEFSYLELNGLIRKE